MKLCQYLFVTIFLCCVATATHAQEQLRLGVVVLVDEPLIVRFVGEKTQQRQNRAALFGGLIGAAVSGGAIAKRNATLAKRLNESALPMNDRSERLWMAIQSQFRTSAPKLKLVLLGPDVLADGKPDFKIVRQQDLKHVLVVSENAGLATPLGGDGQLAAYVKGKAQLYADGRAKAIYRQTLDATGASADDFALALDSPDFVSAQYNEVANALALRLYRHMSGRDALHEVAKNTAFEGDFPSVKVFLKQQGKLFKLVREKPKGWRAPRSGTPFAHSAFPVKDKKTFGISTEIDLLAAELGTDFEVADEYFAYYFNNLGELGFPVAEAEELPELGLDSGWSGFQMPDARGGWRFVVHKLVGKRALIHHIVVLEEDPNRLLKKYRSEIISLVGGATLVDG